jgi:DNA-binding LytR/AlgR family response regulator
MGSKKNARVARGDTGAARLGFFRVHLDSPTQVHQYLRRLIRSSGSRTADLARLDYIDSDTGTDAFCLIDASVDTETRCGAVFQLRPSHKLLFGGVYMALALETPAGAAYLQLMRTSPATPTSAGEALGIDSSLSTLLVQDGSMVRSAVLDDVTHLSAEQNYVRLHLANDESVVTRGPLQKYSSALPAHFLRLSRRLIVNVAQVQRVKRITRDLCVVSFVTAEQSIRLGRKASVLLRNAMMGRSLLPMARATPASRTRTIR